MRDYPTLVEVLAIHARLIEIYGGAGGLRDPGLLEAALFRPQTGYYSGLMEEAAALWESLAQNHPFVDGNKRVAFAVTNTFLQMNGGRITAGPEAIWRFISEMYETRTFNYDRLAEWLRANVQMIEK